MSNEADFVVKNGSLEKYTGTDEVVVIPESVSQISNWVFRDNETVKKVILGAQVLYISSWGFDGPNQIEEYEVSPENPRFCSIDGVLFSKDGKKLIAFPCGRGGEYEIPEGTEEIGAYAFQKNDNLTAVDFPESLCVVGAGAFLKCNNIPSFFLPENVVDVDASSSFGKNVAFIDVSPNNKKFTTLDGILYGGKFKTVHYCPPCKEGEVTLPKTVTGINASAFEHCAKLTAIQIPDAVTKIGAMAFFGCTGLTELKLPAKLTTIGSSAFCRCTALREITVPAGVTLLAEGTFEECRALESATLPEGLTAIAGKAFHECDSLKSIVVPPIVSKLGGDVFPDTTAVICPMELFKRLSNPTKESTGMKYLEDAELFSEKLAEAVVAYIKKNKSVFLAKIVESGNAPALEALLGVVGATKAVVEECKNLLAEHENPELSAVLQNSGSKKATPTKKEKAPAPKEAPAAEETGKVILSAQEAKKLFRYTETPVGVTINGYKGKDSVVVIPDQIGEYPVICIKKQAFNGNETMEEVVLPDSIQKIENAFGSCSNLKKINLPKSLVELGLTAFRGCEKLQRTEIPASLKKVGEETFSKCPAFADENGFVIVCKVLYGYYGNAETVVVPDNVEMISHFAFAENSTLKEIVLPKKLKKIGYMAFQNCTALETLTLPSSLTAMLDNAFAGCVNLTEVTVSSNMRYLDVGVFSSCPKLSKMRIAGASTEIIGYFMGCNAVTLSAPANSYAETYAKEKEIPFVAE